MADGTIKSRYGYHLSNQGDVIMTTKTITVTDLSRASRKSPKLIRRRLRDGKPPVKPLRGEGWTFPLSAKPKLLAFLRTA